MFVFLLLSSVLLWFWILNVSPLRIFQLNLVLSMWSEFIVTFSHVHSRYFECIHFLCYALLCPRGLFPFCILNSSPLFLYTSPYIPQRRENIHYLPLWIWWFHLTLLFGDRVSWIPGWLWTHYIAEEDLELLFLLHHPSAGFLNTCFHAGIWW